MNQDALRKFIADAKESGGSELANYQLFVERFFLMRCLFTMFAEDAKLIPEKGFEKLLGQLKDTPKNFVPALESLWSVMDKGGYAPHLNATLKRFNGGLFSQHRALPLEADQINELWIAAQKGWGEVEPAIFGTLLERALDSRERSKLGAHYAPAPMWSGWSFRRSSRWTTPKWLPNLREMLQPMLKKVTPY